VRLVALACFAAPAFADPVADFGGTGCTLHPVAGQAHVAEVHCRNVETSGPAYDEGAMDAGGLVVGLTVWHGPGDIPDRFDLTAPDGHVVIPDVLLLDEHTRGVALVYPWVGM
jgi:hypothetical protein